MPINPTLITQAILAAGPDLKGPSWQRLASMVGTATAAWAVIPSNLVLQGVVTGTVGSGTVTGKFFVTPVPIIVPANLSLVGLSGPIAPSMGRAIGMGVATAFNASASYQGVSVGVGVGSDVSRVAFANSSTLISTLNLTASGMGLTGMDISLLSTGIGLGIANLLMSGNGTGIVTGPTGPTPGTGTSVSRVF